MKRAQYLILAMLSLLLFSCNEKAKTLKPVSSKLSGSLAECFEVLVKDYKIVGNQVNLEFVRIKEGVMEPEITAEFLDENDNVLATIKADKNSNKDEMRFLLANKVGESSTIAFTIDNGSPTKVRIGSLIPSEENSESLEVAMDTEVTQVDRGMEEIEAPIVKDEEVEVEVAEVNEDDEDDEEEDDEDDEEETPTQSVRSSSSRDWDKVLDDYESYVDHYLSLLKKASSGDLSAMTDYAIVLEKAEKLDKELNAAQNEMTSAQMKRYIRITKKMTDAAYDMYDKMY